MKFSLQTLIWSFLLVAVVIVGFLAFTTKPIEVETALVTESDLRITVQEDGKTRIREKYVVSTPVSGRLSRIELRPGDEICGEGQLIAVIMPAEPAMLDARAKAQARSRVEQATAAVNRSAAAAKQVQVDLELAKSKFERAKKLVQSNSISRDEYDVARSDYLSLSQSTRTTAFDQEIAKYELKTAKAALLQFSDDENVAALPFEVYAPVCGKVLQVFQESATVVNVGMPLVELGDPRNLEMEIDVLSTDAVQIRSGSRLLVNHWGGKRPLTGIVRVVEPAAFTKISSLGVEEQRVNVIADFDESNEGLDSLGDGFRIEAEITVKEITGVLQVPNSSLFRHQRKWHVFAVEAGCAVMKPVVIGAQNETNTEIKTGLSQGDEVILYPSDMISDQAKVVTRNQVQ